MTAHALNNQELTLLREEMEMLMEERKHLLQIVGAAVVLTANVDPATLPQDQDTINAAEVLSERINALTEETLSDALDSVKARIDIAAQASMI